LLPIQESTHIQPNPDHLHVIKTTLALTSFFYDLFTISSYMKIIRTSTPENNRIVVLKRILSSREKFPGIVNSRAVYGKLDY
jgi:hypothetical protein